MWESARFTGFFLASSFFYISNIVHARPHAGNANRWAAQEQIHLWFASFVLVIGSEIQIHFLAVASFQEKFWVWFSASEFSSSRLFLSALFSSLAKVQVHLLQVFKIGLSFLCQHFCSSLVLICGCRACRDTKSFSFSRVHGRLCRLSKLACFLFAKFRASWVCKILSVSLAVSFFGKVRFSKISVPVHLCFYLAKSIFTASVLVGCVFWVLVKSKVACKIQSSWRCCLFQQRFW